MMVTMTLYYHTQEDTPEAVHVDAWSRSVDTITSFGEANLLSHVYVVYLCSSLNKRPVEEISVVCDKDVRLYLQGRTQKTVRHKGLGLDQTRWKGPSQILPQEWEMDCK